MTRTSTTPSLPLGAVTVSLLRECTFSCVPGTPPNVTLVRWVKPLPLTVTLVPPATAPDVGDSPVTVGADARMDCCAAPTLGACAGLAACVAAGGDAAGVGSADATGRRQKMSMTSEAPRHPRRRQMI
ncbi:MAG: hypothetical protein QM619_15715 [Micropruina sp.]